MMTPKEWLGIFLRCPICAESKVTMRVEVSFPLSESVVIASCDTCKISARYEMEVEKR